MSQQEPTFTNEDRWRGLGHLRHGPPYTPTAIRRAGNAGVKCIEHGQLIDEPTAKLLADKGIWCALYPRRNFPHPQLVGRVRGPATLLSFHPQFPRAEPRDVCLRKNHKHTRMDLREELIRLRVNPHFRPIGTQTPIVAH